MKKILATILLTTSLSATAAPVFLYPTCNTYNGECTLYNSSGKDISCSIQIQGWTKNGRMLSAFEYRMLYSGMFAWIKINHYDINDPITSLQANANCNTTN